MKLLLGDCLDKLKELEDNSVDSIVTDPPYGLSFMGKKWDYDVPTQEIWQECLRVLKHGGHLLAFAGSRTYHRMAVRIEDAGFEIRDQIMWIYGSGFPKSLNIGKGVDKKLGNERESYYKPIAYPDSDCWGTPNNNSTGEAKNPSSYSIKKEKIAVQGGMRKTNRGNSEWEGWGTALKPAHEPIVMARKPLSEKTVVDNVLEWGTGGINIDDSRIGVSDNDDIFAKNPHTKGGFGHSDASIYGNSKGSENYDPSQGRFPANVIFDEEAGKILDEQTGELLPQGGLKKTDISKSSWFGVGTPLKTQAFYGDKGGASRFFYCPKTSKKDRGDGNIHPTVKPTDLMLYLIRLVTPKDGITLDPFMGSGSTGKAALKGGFDFIGIEREQEYFDIAKARIEHENNNLFKK